MSTTNEGKSRPGEMDINSIQPSGDAVSDSLMISRLYSQVAPNAILDAGGRADNVGCHPGTREQIIDLVQRWMDDEDGSVPTSMWLSAPPATAKSIIVQTIARRCEEHLTMAIKYLGAFLQSIFLDAKYQPEQDARSFATAELTKLDTLGDHWPSNEDIDSLVKTFTDRFIFDTRVIPHLANSSTSSRERVQDLVHSATSWLADLDELYIYLLSRVGDRATVLDLLATEGRAPAYLPPSFDPYGGQWESAPPNEGYSPTSHADDGDLPREMRRAIFSPAQNMKPPLAERPGQASRSSAGMFTNAHIERISGSTFVNVAHIYESNPLAQGGGPAFPIAMVGLQAISFAARPQYQHCDRLSNSLPLLIPEPTSSTDVALRFPLLGQEMRTILMPFAFWFFIKMWVQRRAIEHH